MIQEGTSFLKPEHDVPGDDQSWIEQLVEKSFFKFFPQLQDQILELGQISNFPAGHKFFKADEKMHSLFVPLNRPLSLRFTSGRFGEEKVFSNIKVYDMFSIIKNNQSLMMNYLLNRCCYLLKKYHPLCLMQTHQFSLGVSYSINSNLFHLLPKELKGK